MVVVVGAGGDSGLGYTYSTAAVPRVIADVLRPSARWVPACAGTSGKADLNLR